MTPEEAIFAAAAALPAAERTPFLDAACAGQPGMRARVEALLRSHDATGFMEIGVEPPYSAETAEERGQVASAQPGERIGRYRLLQQIGEGGFGVVWMAEQVEPVTRRVALKIIKAGMDTKEVIARFEAERQALAMMDHPNIARVFDAGATDKGRPFFVMELVKGIPITKFCDEQQFTARQRLELFSDVCSAINHAHQKGVIHRDIKPSNVMVTLNADRPVVKVIDFGIAKATQGKLTDKTLFTRFEQFVGTPAYMSPEQAAISELDIDTRSDIYALGVLLYELLTGKPPFDAKTLVSAGYEEMRRIIREVEPVRPSLRLDTIVGDERTALARSRQTEPEKLNRMVEPDLDWIVMKSIEKDRTRRYETANGLALDIQRYLANEPVTAAAPGMAYLFRKFARRHKAALGLAALIAVVLVSATGISLWQANRAITAKKETADALGEVEMKKAEVDRKNTGYRAMLAEAARSDRAVAEERLRAGGEREAFAHLARACEYDPLSTFAAEKAAASLNTWRHPLLTTILAGHESSLRSAQFSRDGARIVTASDDKTARVWDATTGKCLVTLAGHESSLRSVQFSSDGSRIVTASEDKTARVWDAATGKSLAMLQGHDDRVISAQFSTDGARIVTASWDKTARVWDAATGKCLATLAGHEAGVKSAQFSPDGARIVTASRDKTARVWDAATGLCFATLEGHRTYTYTWIDVEIGQSLATLEGHGSSVLSAQFSPDGARIVTTLGDTTVQVWNAATCKNLTTLAGHENRVISAQFSKDDARIVTASKDRTARVWDAATGKCLATLTGHEDRVIRAQFSTDGARIVTASWDKTARVWDAATGKCLATLTGHEQVFDAQFSRDGSRIVTVALDKTARVWEVATGQSLATLAGHEAGMNSVQFSTDGSRIATASDDKTARVWEAATGKCLATLAIVLSAQFSTEGTRIVNVSGDNTAWVWDAAMGKRLATLAGHGGVVWSAQFSQDGARVVTASYDTTARVWDAATGICLVTLAGHESSLRSAQFSRDGARIVTASDDKTARVWDAATGKCLATLAGHGDRVIRAQFSPDGARIVTASWDKTARLWDAATGKCLATLTGHEQVFDAQFSRDGSRIVTAALGKTARVWDAATGQNLATLAGHEAGVNSVQFSPDGARIVTASDDKTARVWDAATGKCLVTLAGHEDRVISAQFGPDGSRIVTASRDKTARIWTILPATVGPPPAWFADFLRCLAQMRLNSDGEPEPLKPDDWLALRDRLRAVVRASVGQDTPYLRILRRYVTE